MPFDISTVRHFSAAHALRFPDGSTEPVHGHNWRVRVTVGAPALDPVGCVMDFHELERLVDEAVVPMHNRHLNDLPPFDSTLNPTAENVAYYVARMLRLPPGVGLASVDVWETDDNAATYRP